MSVLEWEINWVSITSDVGRRRMFIFRLAIMLCAQFSGNRHARCWIALYTILHILLSYYHWKNNNRTPMVSHVNRPLTREWLPMFTTCHRIRHIIIFSSLAALSPSSLFFFYLPFFVDIIVTRSRLLRHLRYCCSRTIYTYILTYTHIELSCKSWYYTASSVIYIYTYFSLPMIRIRQCWQTRILWSIHLTIIYH